MPGRPHVKWRDAKLKPAREDIAAAAEASLMEQVGATITPENAILPVSAMAGEVPRSSTETQPTSRLQSGCFMVPTSPHVLWRAFWKPITGSFRLAVGSTVPRGTNVRLITFQM